MIILLDEVNVYIDTMTLIGDSDCYKPTRADKVTDCEVIYDGDIPISLTGTPIPEEVTILCPYCGAEIHMWTGTGSVYCYNCGMTF